MRYIEIDGLREGMVLAQPLYGSNFGILLGEGMTLNHYHIQRINELGYGGVYIHDQLSEGITARHVLEESTRIECVRSAFELLRQAEQKGAARYKVTRARQDQLIMPIIDGLIACKHRMIDMYDTKPSEFYIYYHAANVTILSLLVGLEMGLSGTELYELGLSAMLHDVGNLFLPKSILEKPSRLTEQEFDIIKMHSQMGFDYLREHYDISIEACMGALQHHENYNGTGYPSRLKGDRISIYGRIIALTDVYDAMTSRRPYRKPLTPLGALEYLGRNSGTMFDPKVVQAMRKCIAPYPAGTCVELNTGARCIVLQSFIQRPERPRMKALQSISGEPQCIDLCNDPELARVNIVRIIEVEQDGA